MTQQCGIIGSAAVVTFFGGAAMLVATLVFATLGITSLFNETDAMILQDTARMMVKTALVVTVLGLGMILVSPDN